MSSSGCVGACPCLGVGSLPLHWLWRRTSGPGRGLRSLAPYRRPLFLVTVVVVVVDSSLCLGSGFACPVVFGDFVGGAEPRPGPLSARPPPLPVCCTVPIATGEGVTFSAPFTHGSVVCRFPRTSVGVSALFVSAVSRVFARRVSVVPRMVPPCGAVTCRTPLFPDCRTLGFGGRAIFVVGSR